jgi:hypothetical protein
MKKGDLHNPAGHSSLFGLSTQRHVYTQEGRNQQGFGRANLAPSGREMTIRNNLTSDSTSRGQTAQ